MQVFILYQRIKGELGELLVKVQRMVLVLSRGKQLHGMCRLLLLSEDRTVLVLGGMLPRLLSVHVYLDMQY